MTTMLPPAAPDALVRVLATNSMLGTVIPMPATHGEGGSIPGVAALFERQSESLPTVWVDSGDMTMSGHSGRFGFNALLELPKLPLAAACVGNHELDDGAQALCDLAAKTTFPILCADRDLGLPGTAMIDTPHGLIGIVGVSHPFADELTHSPTRVSPRGDDLALIAERAQALRRDGARWVLALLHDGATWWTTASAKAPEHRVEWLARSTRAWASGFDAILGGHTLTAWTGDLHGVPAGQAHACAASVLPVDLCAGPPYVRIHPPARVPSITPTPATPTAIALQAAAGRTIGELAHTWESRPGAKHYLPNLVAVAMREAGEADAAFLPAGELFTQAPIDGVVAALRAGPVTELDLLRLYPFGENAIVVLELAPEEFHRLVSAHDVAVDPTNAGGDGLWWNWARAPAGTASGSKQPSTVAVESRDVLRLFCSWLDRDVTAHQSSISGREAVERLIADQAGPACE
jgi:2',3'-cyclic-nucleotide 2'-phosphodiesterase (5'-nucleotidase family)